MTRGTTSDIRDYEAIVRKLIADGCETRKIDLKRFVDFDSRQDVAELARLVLAIANTDSDELDDIGYIIVGASRREIHGGADWLAGDSSATAIIDKLGRYIRPLPIIEVRAFQEPGRGWFGAILVKPSPHHLRPHFVAKEFDGLMRRDECYVRPKDSVQLASREDYDRMYAQRHAKPSPLPRLAWLIEGEAYDTVTVPPRGIVPPLVDADIIERNFSPEAIEAMPENKRVEAKRFNDATKQHIAVLEGMSNAYEKWYLCEKFSCDLHVALGNEGTAPLERAICFVDVPSDFEVFDCESIPERVDIPEPPPSAVERRIAASLGLFGVATSPIMAISAVNNKKLLESLRPLGPRNMVPNIDGLMMEVDNRFHGSMVKVRHGFTVPFRSPAILVAPAAIGDYEIRYVIHADNLPEAVEDVLIVEVREGAPRRYDPKLHTAGESKDE